MPRSRPAPLPATYDPQLAVLAKMAPDGDEWLHEVKFDGYRIGCRVDGNDVQLVSRRGKEWTPQFPELAAAARRLPVRQALLDGEAAVLRADGRTSFQALQNAFGGGSRAGLVYVAFDLLHLDGQDLTALPLEDRKARLRALLDKAPADPRLRFSDHVVGHGPSFCAEACRRGLEGIVSKPRAQPYQTGRRAGWLKIKCVKRQEFVIGGFTDPEGSRAGIGALLVGLHDGAGRLAFAGKVGTGFTQKSARALRQRLEALDQKDCPFAERPPGWLGGNAHWVRPELVAEVSFAELTDDGKVRHGSFQGLREDKPAAEVVAERPAAPAPSKRAAGPPSVAGVRPPAPAPSKPAARRAAGAVEVAGVRISNPDRVLFPALGLTKRGLAEYYVEIAPTILPHVGGRPLTLVRCPKGVPAGTDGRGKQDGCFYMKHSHVWAPEALHRVRIREKTKVGEYLVVEDVTGLVALAQMDVLEIHLWNSTARDLERPDRVIFDLDPGPDVRWPAVVQAALLVRERLKSLGLESFVKNTGGRGLHVTVPFQPERSWDECLAFSRALATAIASERPRAYTVALPKAGRESKILIDYLRNNRTATAVAAYSTRARPGGTVSVPLDWDELGARTPSDAFDVPAVLRRVRERGDPWRALLRCRQRLPAGLFRAS